jgi:hypothetical protein
MNTIDKNSEIMIQDILKNLISNGLKKLKIIFNKSYSIVEIL